MSIKGENPDLVCNILCGEFATEECRARGNFPFTRPQHHWKPKYLLGSYARTCLPPVPSVLFLCIGGLFGQRPSANLGPLLVELCVL